VSVIRSWSLVALATLAGALHGPAGAAEPFDPGAEAPALLARYLRIDTTNPPGNEILAARFLKDVLDREGIESRVFESAPGRGNLYARLKGDGSKPAIVLLNHMDVVPADRRHWSVDPFAGLERDGYVWGRGALDMKGMGIMELVTLIALKREGVPLKSDIVFLGTADEEAGGAMGAGHMVKEHFDLIADAGVVVNESGGISTNEDGSIRHYSVTPAEKVPLWLKLTATGTPGHGSRPKPDSAVNRLVEALHRIVQFRTALEVEPIVQAFYADTADLDPSPERRERLRDLRGSLGDPAFAAEFVRDTRNNAAVRNTVAITMLEGSNKVNVIPAEASAQLDVRLLPGHTPEAFIDELRWVIDDDAIRIETLLSFPPSASPADSAFHAAVRDMAARFDPGARVTAPLVSGFTDCHFFREKGIPCYGFVPLKLSARDLEGVHGNDERVSADTLRLGTRMLYDLVRRLATQ
jgi:acetylornithine deacetylase/succinyl-diaminopimelate desuccinylase-like protein